MYFALSHFKISLAKCLQIYFDELSKDDVKINRRKNHTKIPNNVLGIS